MFVMSIHNMHKIQGQVLDRWKNDAQPTRSHRQVTYVTSNASSPAVTQEKTQMHTQTQHTHTQCNLCCTVWPFMSIQETVLRLFVFSRSTFRIASLFKVETCHMVKTWYTNMTLYWAFFCWYSKSLCSHSWAQMRSHNHHWRHQGPMLL